MAKQQQIVKFPLEDTNMVILVVHVLHMEILELKGHAPKLLINIISERFFYVLQIK